MTSLSTLSTSHSRYCICGLSASFPWCDGSHQEEGWQCDRATSASLGFSASPRLENLALKLASHHHGVLVTPHSNSSLRLQKWIVLVEGFEFDTLQSLYSTVKATEIQVLSLGTPINLLQPLFPDASHFALGTLQLLEAFERVSSFLESPFETAIHTPLQSAFVSHAVRDEPVLIPVVQLLRKRFGLSLFLCADSIRSGTGWQEEIEQNLRQQEVVVAILSKQSLESHFCSFELGMAMALNKPIHLLSLDGSLPHVFAQHLQMADLPRLQRFQPWLSTEELLLQEMVKSLTTPALED